MELPLLVEFVLVLAAVGYCVTLLQYTNDTKSVMWISGQVAVNNVHFNPLLAFSLY